jgi:type I restriction enzyme S subunit
MSLPKYPKYKESHVTWLGEIPAQWAHANLKWLSKRYSGGTPDKTKREYWDGGSIPWLNSGTVNEALITAPSAYITQAAFENSSAKWVPSGSLVVALAGQGKTKGMVAQVLLDTTCNQSMAAIVPALRVRSRYLYWWLVRNYQNIRNMAGGDLRDGLNLELLGAIPCPLPSVSEQASIAMFLDSETGKIDALIAEQEKLLTLLAEKRQATISHAVTRGLNPKAQLTNSGVQWLGDLPAHWSGIQLGRLCSSVSDGPHFSPSYVDDGVLFLSARNIKTDGWSLNDAKFVSEDDYAEFSKRVVPEIGDVLYTKGGTTGVARAVDLKERFQVWVHVAVLKLQKSLVTPDFLAYALNSVGCYEQAQLYTRGATNNDLGLTRMVKIILALPPMDEQESIVAFLNAETSKLDALKSKAEHAIILLKERRGALIAAAVTGQIDVRGVVDASETDVAA